MESQPQNPEFRNNPEILPMRVFKNKTLWSFDHCECSRLNIPNADVQVDLSIHCMYLLQSLYPSQESYIIYRMKSHAPMKMAYFCLYIHE